MTVPLQDYQVADSEKQPVEGRFVMDNLRRVGFEVAAYDRRKSLVIDPKLSYSTYYGGSEADSGAAIKVDGEGSVYFTGRTASPLDFPRHNNTQGHFGACEGCTNVTDAFVAKLTHDGRNYVYSTYLV